jgi:hypothetical protein
MTKIRVLVADDHGVVRKGLRFLLERREDLEVVGEACDGKGGGPAGGGTRSAHHRYRPRHAATEWD